MSVSMDTNPSTSTSQDALLTQIEAMGVKSTTSLITLGVDTPVPKETLSNETLDLLEKAATSLSAPANRGRKRLREDPTTADTRTGYPNESKSLYLKTKNLYRRKLSVATNLHHMKMRLGTNKYPTQVDFRCSCPQNRDEKFKSAWQQIVRKCKEDLTYLVLKDLNSKYTLTKTEIQGQLGQLKGVLENEQFQETKKFLDDKYKAAIPIALNRISDRYNQPKRGNTRQRRPPWRPRFPAKRQKVNGNNQLKETLTSLLAQL